MVGSSFRFAGLAALTVWLIATGVSHAAESEAVQSPRSTASLVTEADSVVPGRAFRVGLRLQMARGWHTYWQNPGDAGLPPTLEFKLSGHAKVGKVAWPAPELKPEGPLMTFGYSGDLLLPVTITGATAPLSIELHAEWLICAKVCVPEEGDFRLDIPAGDGEPRAQGSLFSAADRRMPRASTFAASFRSDGTLTIKGLPALEDAFFVPDEPGRIVPSAAQPRVMSDDGLTLKLKAGKDWRNDQTLSGVLLTRDSTGQSAALAIAAISSGDTSPDTEGLPYLLVLAFLGGAILNLMPCVFPVLALKTAGLAGLGGARTGAVLRHVIPYTVGVVLSFAAVGGIFLTARLAGDGIGWGFQFQSPAFVGATAWLLFAVGLNLSGVFEVAGKFTGAGQSLAGRPGWLGDFFTGVLAVLVATPCTAPFMGAAIAGALSAGSVAGLTVFIAMGLGLAAPYVLVALVPGARRLLPRPGAWMDVLKGALAFPMYAAVIWLIWVISQQAGSTGLIYALAGLLLTGFAAWVAGISGTGIRGRRIALATATAAVLTAGALLPLLHAQAPAAIPRDTATGPERFSAIRLAALRAEGRPVFVNMTAAWCVSCLVNEQVALSVAPVQATFAAQGVAYLKGDWTTRDAEISSFLREHGRDGVPFYAVYPRNGAPPIILPQILTPQTVIDAVTAAAG